MLILLKTRGFFSFSFTLVLLLELIISHILAQSCQQAEVGTWAHMLLLFHDYLSVMGRACCRVFTHSHHAKHFWLLSTGSLQSVLYLPIHKGYFPGSV